MTIIKYGYTDPPKVDHHRNGISGESFYVVRFDVDNHTGGKDPMVGIVFEQPGHVAILNVADLLQGIIEFGKNSYRAESFEPMLRRLVAQFETARTPAPEHYHIFANDVCSCGKTWDQVYGKEGRDGFTDLDEYGNVIP